MRRFNHSSRFIEMFGNAEKTKPLSEYIGTTFPGEWGEDDLDGSGVNVIRTTNFTNSGKLDFTNVVIRKIDQAKIDKKHLVPGDIILERSGGTADNPVGRVVYFEADGTFLFNNFTQLLRCKDGVNSLFVFYSLFNYYYTHKNEIRSMGNKTTGIQNLKMDKYWDIPIADASPEQQEQFVCLYKQSDKSKFSNFKSRFIEQFSKPEITRVPLIDLCSLFNDGDWIEAKDQSDSGYRLVQTGNVGVCEYLDKKDHSRFVSEETFKRLNCTEIHSGDILFSRLPDPIGRCCIIPKDFPKAITAVDCTITRLKDNCLPEYLMIYTTTTMYSEQIKKCVTGTTRQRISRGNLAKITIPLPDKTKQVEFVNLVHQADKSKFLN